MDILSIIAKEGIYYYTPREWSDEYDKKIKELVDLELISTLADELNNTDNNNCYVYVAKGNPLKMNWVDTGNGWYSIKSTLGVKCGNLLNYSRKNNSRNYRRKK